MKMVERIGIGADTSFHVSRIKGTSGRRVYLIHGLNEDESAWKLPPYDELTRHLEQAGDEIVFVRLPRVVDSDMMDGGEGYCRSFRKWFDKTDSQLGRARETIIVGASWGGWHAMQVADKADGLLMFKPVIDPAKLEEFWWIGSADCPLRRARKSFAVYAPTDTRVGDASAVLDRLNIPSITAVRGDHGIEPPDVANAILWLDPTSVPKDAPTL